MSTCFCNSSLFHKSLKDAFENFVNKSVAGSTSAELMASFCDNLLKKVILQGAICQERGPGVWDCASLMRKVDGKVSAQG